MRLKNLRIQKQPEKIALFIFGIILVRIHVTYHNMFLGFIVNLLLGTLGVLMLLWSLEYID